MRKRKSRRSHRSSSPLRLVAFAFILALGVFVWANLSELHQALTDPIVLILLATVIVGLGYLYVRIKARRRLRYRTLLQLRELTPTRFELAVADLLHDLGYRQVKRVGGTGDLAADITCRDQHGCSVVVQCKRYAASQRIGSPEIQKFIGMVNVHHHADYGMFVTTTQFTEPAKRLANQHGVRLLDDECLTALLSRRSVKAEHLLHSDLPAVPSHAGGRSPRPGDRSGVRGRVEASNAS